MGIDIIHSYGVIYLCVLVIGAFLCMICSGSELFAVLRGEDCFIFLSGKFPSSAKVNFLLFFFQKKVDSDCGL